MKTLVLTLLCLAISGIAVGETGPDEWQFQLTPYIWLPTIDGTLNYGPPPGSGGSPNVEVGPTDWLELLNFGVLISGSARKGRFSIFTDVVYLSMTKNGDGRVVSVDGTVSGPGGSINVPVSADLTLNTRDRLRGAGLDACSCLYRDANSNIIPRYIRWRTPVQRRFFDPLGPDSGNYDARRS